MTVLQLFVTYLPDTKPRNLRTIVKNPAQVEKRTAQKTSWDVFEFATNRNQPNRFGKVTWCRFGGHSWIMEQRTSQVVQNC